MQTCCGGLRGGGGNFGAVTRFDFRVSPIGPVTGGVAFFPDRKSRQVDGRISGMVGSLSDAFTTILVLASAPAEPPSPAEMRRKLSVGIVGCHCGKGRHRRTGADPEPESSRRPLRRDALPAGPLRRGVLSRQTVLLQGWFPTGISGRGHRGGAGAPAGAPIAAERVRSPSCGGGGAPHRGTPPLPTARQPTPTTSSPTGWTRRGRRHPRLGAELGVRPRPLRPRARLRELPLRACGSTDSRNNLRKRSLPTVVGAQAPLRPRQCLPPKPEHRPQPLRPLRQEEPAERREARGRNVASQLTPHVPPAERPSTPCCRWPPGCADMEPVARGEVRPCSGRLVGAPGERRSATDPPGSARCDGRFGRASRSLPLRGRGTQSPASPPSPTRGVTRAHA